MFKYLNNKSTTTVVVAQGIKSSLFADTKQLNVIGKLKNKDLTFISPIKFVRLHQELIDYSDMWNDTQRFS
jgi:hypothetical protein